MLAIVLPTLVFFVLIGRNIIKKVQTDQVKIAKETEIALEADYTNPFDKKSQYVNPFDQTKNPFDDLK